MMRHEITINLNMLCALIENIIMHNLNSITIVTMYDSRRRMCKTHIFQQPAKSEKFKGSTARARYSASMLERDTICCFLLRQEIRVSQKETKTSSRAAVSRISIEVKGGMS